MSWKRYAQKWPEELNKVQKAMSSDISRGIFLYLLMEGKKSFSDISEDLKIESNKLSYHLNNLVRYGMVTHRYSNERSEKVYSYYSPSNLGELYAQRCLDVVHSLYQHPDHFEDVRMLIDEQPQESENVEKIKISMNATTDIYPDILNRKKIEEIFISADNNTIGD